MEGPLTGTRVLPARVKALLAQRGMSQIDLGKAIGRSQPLVSQFLTGTRNLSIETLDRLASALTVDVADLFPRAEDAAALALTPEETQLVTAYREADPKLRRAVAALLEYPADSSSPADLVSGHRPTVDVQRLANTIAEFIRATVQPPAGVSAGREVAGS